MNTVTPLENYKSIIEKYFGPNTVTFDATKNTRNEIIGALYHLEQFETFRNNFHKRLERLAALYTNSIYRKKLLETVNEVASAKNWEGAYSELVALDFLNSDTHWLSNFINLSTSLSASETLADDLGMSNVDFDGYYSDFNIYFDIKVLSDKSGSILNGIINDAKRHLNLCNVLIKPEYSPDIDYKCFEANRVDLLQEIQTAQIEIDKTTFLKSECVTDLSYRFLWGSGVLSTIGTYDPYQHALNHHKLLFTHAKKFSKTSPSLIVFIIFPWFSESILTHDESKENFYRAFCRRFFCQYAKDQQEAKNFVRGIRTKVPIAEVTSMLSGVLFVNDKSIKEDSPDDQNVDAFAYLNPNALHKVSGRYRDYLKSLNFYIDDFQYDNY